MEMGRRSRDRMIVGFTTIYAISVYHHYSCEFESRSSRWVLDTTIPCFIQSIKHTATI